MAHMYKIARTQYEEMERDDPAGVLNFRLHVVDTYRTGANKTMDPNTVQPIDVAGAMDPEDRAHLTQIHPGRLEVETEQGSKLVAQVNFSLFFYAIIRKIEKTMFLIGFLRYIWILEGMCRQITTV